MNHLGTVCMSLLSASLFLRSSPASAMDTTSAALIAGSAEGDKEVLN